MQNRGYSMTIKEHRFEFIRVDKKTARRAYNNGLNVVFCPVNISPLNKWGLEMTMNCENLNCNFIEFDKLVNEYEFYNCNSETGKYTAFYIPTKNDSYDYDFLKY